MKNKVKNPVLIIGLGKSGIAACKLLEFYNVNYGVTDIKSSNILLNILKQNNLNPNYIESGSLKIEFLDLFNTIVVSPGCNISKILPNIDLSKYNFISEIELGYRYYKGDIIAVTGTNGKTTVTSLIGEIINEYTKSSFVCGNIGLAFCNFINSMKMPKCSIIETSSYQLENVHYFKPNISIFTNISPDHLERHNTINEYLKVKLNIAKNMDKNNHFILNHSLKSEIEKNNSVVNSTNIHFFSIKNCSIDNQICWVEKGYIVLKKSDKLVEKVIKVNDLSIVGAHNIENVMAGIAASYLYGIPLDSIKKSVKSFKGVEHRIERIPIKRNFNVYNDSKSTNPESTLVAMKSMVNSYVLILGGSPKTVDYQLLNSGISKKLKKIILCGQTSKEIFDSLNKNCCNYEIIYEFDKAVKTAWNLCSKNNYDLLLSPACASFDFFDNFEHRGKHFKKIIMDLDNG